MTKIVSLKTNDPLAIFEKGCEVETEQGKGRIVQINTDPKLKPLVVELEKPHRGIRGNETTLTYYHVDQVRLV